MADKNTYTSTAKVIDGILVLSLPDAILPVVWQMELGQSKSSALEIRNTENGEFVLTLKTPRQDILEIATYANRDLAIKALLAASAALEKAQGQLKSAPAGGGYPVPAVSRTSKSGAFCILKKSLLWLAGIAGSLILLLVIGWLLLATIRVIMAPGSGGTAVSASNGGAVSADEFLENR